MNGKENRSETHLPSAFPSSKLRHNNTLVQALPYTTTHNITTFFLIKLLAIFCYHYHLLFYLIKYNKSYSLSRQFVKKRSTFGTPGNHSINRYEITSSPSFSPPGSFRTSKGEITSVIYLIFKVKKKKSNNNNQIFLLK